MCAGLPDCPGAAVVGLDGNLVGIHTGVEADWHTADEEPHAEQMDWFPHLELRQAPLPAAAASPAAVEAAAPDATPSISLTWSESAHTSGSGQSTAPMSVVGARSIDGEAADVVGASLEWLSLETRVQPAAKTAEAAVPEAAAAAATAEAAGQREEEAPRRGDSSQHVAYIATLSRVVWLLEAVLNVPMRQHPRLRNRAAFDTKVCAVIPYRLECLADHS